MSSREDYTWAEATKDLALLTPLTLQEAGVVCREVESAGLNPHDALPYLKMLFREQDVARKALALNYLLTLLKE